MKFRNKNFNLNGDIVDFDIKNPITLEVKQFYEKCPFPNYKIDDNKHTILEKGNKNSFFAELKNFIGFNKSVLEVGSGTSQLSNYLAIGTNNQIYAFDSSIKSLEIGNNFAKKIISIILTLLEAIFLMKFLKMKFLILFYVMEFYTIQRILQKHFQI